MSNCVCCLSFAVVFFFSKLIFSTSFVEWQTDWIPPDYTGRQRGNAAPLLEFIYGTVCKDISASNSSNSAEKLHK